MAARIVTYEASVDETDLATNFRRDGFVIVDLFDAGEMRVLKEALRSRLNEIFAEAIPERQLEVGHLEHYHLRLAGHDHLHRMLADLSTRRLELDEELKAILFGARVRAALHRIADDGCLKVGRTIPGLGFQPDCCGFRVIRPQVDPAPGIHTDGMNTPCAFTMWVPLTGFDRRYSLALFPGSHREAHDRRGLLSQTKPTVRYFSFAYAARFQRIRPSLRSGQAIVFHPNLLHGGGENEGHETRASLEVRFFGDATAFAVNGHEPGT